MEEQCEVCAGIGWAVFTVSEGVALQAIQRCDQCERYEDDLAAADASGIVYTVLDRGTGEPCHADRDHPWECVPLVALRAGPKGPPLTVWLAGEHIHTGRPPDRRRWAAMIRQPKRRRGSRSR
jgi:hypothetical protein